MLLTHAKTLAQARFCLASLADNANTVQASSAYERTLIELDWIHGDDVPALDAGVGLPHDRDSLLSTATSAIEGLAAFGVDLLQLELLLAQLAGACSWDIP